MARKRDPITEMDVTYVYVIATEGTARNMPVKIGIATDPNVRLKGLQTGNPHPIYVAARYRLPSREHASYIEATFHRENEGASLNGEWFRIPAETAKRRLAVILGDVVLARLTDYEKNSIAFEWTLLIEENRALLEGKIGGAGD